MSKQHPLHYSIVPSNPEAHLFKISLTIQNPDPEGQVISMPSWIPGSYMIRDFARTVITIDVRGDDRDIAISKLDKNHWKIAPHNGPLTINYEVYAWDLSVRSAHLDTTHGFFNGSSVFLEVIGQSDQPCSVDIIRPQGEAYNSWRVATSMTRLDTKLHQFGRYQATNYDELIDHPVEMGNFSLATFNVAGIPHDIVLTGKHNADIERLSRDLKLICEEHVKLFSELPEMERYVFMTMVVGDGYGGLEHRASTALICSRSHLPLKQQKEISDDYLTFLGLCSHEYFHTWNVKRIKPEAYLPYDLNHEVYTQQLWAFEGITSYYDDLGLVRSGLITTEKYLELVGQMMTRVHRGEGRFKQSLADSSFDTWTKFYKQDESAPNNIVSYYAKGALIALALDITIRQATQHNASLDQVMHRLWQEHGKPLVGVPEKRIEEIASEVANTDLSEFFQRYLYSTQDIPFSELMQEFGIQWQLQPTASLDDKGGQYNDKPKSSVTWLGARFANDSIGAKLVNVLDNSPAQKAGLSANDVIIAFNGIKASKQNIEKLIGQYYPGDLIDVHAFRRDELMTFNITLETAPETTCAMQIDKQASDKQNNYRCSWLSL